MPAVLTRLTAAIRAAAANSEVRHDVALFATALVATGVFDRGAPLTLSAVAAAVTVAARRAVQLRIAARRKRTTS